MSVKRLLLMTCAVIATTAAVRSQSITPENGPATGQAGASPASILAPSKASTAPAFVLAPDAAASPPQTAERPAAIDLSALYYFASQNDLGRVAAEIRLIRAKNPDWQPPEDLFAAAGSGADEQPLWDLFGKHDLAGLHAKIDQMKEAQPGWQPSSNLAGKLALAEAHDTLVKASDDKRWGAVIEVATGNKMLLTCGDVDALWRTAEALARTGNEKSALDAYRYVLATCTPPAIRLATVQKAGATLASAEALDSLIQMGRRQADGRSEFDPIRLDRLRRVVGDATSDPAAPAAAQADLDALAANANTPEGQADAQLLGWYNYARTAYPAAQQWFRTALKSGPEAKSAEGLVLALRAGGSGDDARKAAVQYAGLNDANRNLMVEVLSTSLTDPTAHPVSDEEMTALAKAVDDLKSQEGAQALQIYASNKNDAAGAKQWADKYTQWRAEDIESQKSSEAAAALGWQFFHDHDVASAENWFRKSADWQSNEQAALGLVLSARLLNHKSDFKARIAEFGRSYPTVAKLGADAQARFIPSRTVKVAGLCRRGVACLGRATDGNRGPGSGQWDQAADAIINAYKNGQYDTAMTMLDQRRAKRSEPRGLAVVRGWTLYQKGDWEGAKQAFANLDGGAYSREREEGLRVIELSYTPSRFR